LDSRQRLRRIFSQTEQTERAILYATGMGMIVRQLPLI
jgi:hypothetical protein